MRTNGWLTAAVITVLVGAVAGCGAGPATTTNHQGGTSAAASPSTSALPDATPQLMSALKGVAGQGMRLTATARGGELECDHQASNEGFSCSGDTKDGALDMVVIGPQLYLKTPHTGSLFLRYTVAKLPERMDLLILLDPLFGRQFLASATSVHAGRPKTLVATIDLTKLPVTGADKRIADVLAAHAGARANAVPMTVTLDDTGRLAGMQATFPAATKADEVPYTVKITDIDPGVTVFPPQKGRWGDAPASAYK